MLQRFNDIGWRYWAASDLLLLGTVFGCAWSIAALAGLTFLHCIHFVLRERSLAAFPLQVRLAWAVLLVAGMWPPLGFMHWIQLAGTSAMVFAGYCPLARTLALMPWNRGRPLDRTLILRTLLGPPSANAIIDG